MDNNLTANQLQEIVNKKQSKQMELKKSLINSKAEILKKSKFYKISYYEGLEYSDLREHIANYRGYSIFIKQEELIKSLENKVIKVNGDEITLSISLIEFKDLKYLKKINGNVIRKKQPKTLRQIEKLSLILNAMQRIDDILSD